MMQINHCSALEIAGFRTEAEDIDTPSFVSDWRWRGAEYMDSPDSYKVKKNESLENQNDRCYSHLFTAFEG